VAAAAQQPLSPRSDPRPRKVEVRRAAGRAQSDKEQSAGGFKPPVRRVDPPSGAFKRRAHGMGGGSSTGSERAAESLEVGAK